MKNCLLMFLAKEHRVPVERLRTDPELKWDSLGELCRFPEKEKYPLKDWDEAVSFLLSCETHFASYEEIRKSLKPFSLKLR